MKEIWSRVILYLIIAMVIVGSVFLISAGLLLGDLSLFAIGCAAGVSCAALIFALILP